MVEIIIELVGPYYIFENIKFMTILNVVISS